MLEKVRDLPGENLDRAAYHADFARESDRLTGIIWKLERAQRFREPHDPSWQALMAGDWPAALRVFEDERPALRTDAQANADRGTPVRRLRIIEYPISAYVQWEMQSFRVLAEEGFELRVLKASEVDELEHSAPLPEVVVIAEQILYEVRYDADWTPIGARRINDEDAAKRAAIEISELYERGEPLLDFFHREIAPLPAPKL